MPLLLRPATLADEPALRALIERSARTISREHYTQAQVDAAVGTALGLDTQLLRDQTYFVIEENNVIIACGGWSMRRTLFGADANPNREPERLNPAVDAARIRAFYVDPGHARRGFGRMLLERCEQAIRAAGFTAAELAATFSGHGLYLKAGYVGDQPNNYPLPGGLTIAFIPMRKELRESSKR